jgi:hypothetical protein
MPRSNCESRIKQHKSAARIESASQKTKIPEKNSIVSGISLQLQVAHQTADRGGGYMRMYGHKNSKSMPAKIESLSRNKTTPQKNLSV